MKHRIIGIITCVLLSVAAVAQGVAIYKERERQKKDAEYIATHMTPVVVIPQDAPKFTHQKPLSYAHVPEKVRDRVFTACRADIPCVRKIAKCIGQAFADDINKECEGKSAYCWFRADAFTYEEYSYACLETLIDKRGKK